MTSTIQAIPTHYKGIDFRSRTEARWAVFFDEVRIRWDFEAEGYELNSGRFLPDFWLPDLQVWVEVKPKPFDDTSRKRFIKAYDQCSEMTMATKRPTCLTLGPPSDPRDGTMPGEPMSADTQICFPDDDHPFPIWNHALWRLEGYDSGDREFFPVPFGLCTSLAEAELSTELLVSIGRVGIAWNIAHDQRVSDAIAASRNHQFWKPSDFSAATRTPEHLIPRKGDCLRFSKYDRVVHRSFGNGYVVNVVDREGGDQTITVHFETGMKSLLASLANLERLP